ncbi:MAG: HEPN domain-containing protein [Mariprofundus sp.]
MQPCDLAKKFLALAARDCIALRVLAADNSTADETIGFHAQQAVEKCLKAVLIAHAIEFRKTHALDELIDLLKKHDLPLPPDADELDMLTPYAVLLRYDFDVCESLSREDVIALVRKVYAWTESLIAVHG